MQLIFDTLALLGLLFVIYVWSLLGYALLGG